MYLFFYSFIIPICIKTSVFQNTGTFFLSRIQNYKCVLNHCVSKNEYKKKSHTGCPRNVETYFNFLPVGEKWAISLQMWSK